MNSVSRRNGRLLIAEVKKIAAHHDWTRHHARRVARMSLMCAKVESGLQNYANANVTGSVALPHDAIGYDHDSVGCMQQRVGFDGSGSGGWGSLAHCQSVPGATRSFVMRLVDKGLDTTGRDARLMGVAVQSVQVSAYPDRYEQKFAAAGRFLAVHWLTTPPLRRPKLTTPAPTSLKTT